MHRNYERYLTLAAIAALTIFAGQSYATLHKKSLFTEVPVEAGAVSQDTVLADGANPVILSVQTPASIVENSSSTQANFADTTTVSNGTQHFRIKSRLGNDDD